jgi:hypothetical protein
MNLRDVTGALRVLTCCVGLAATGCSQAPAPLPCDRLGGAPMLEYALFFGRTSVTDQEWAEFTAQVVTSQLPAGFTAFDADGQWMNPITHRVGKERTKVIVVALPETPAGDAAIAAIKDAYRTRFHQQSVGTTVHPVCGAF